VTSWRTAPIAPSEHVLLEFAVRVARQPDACRQADIETLRKAGWSDRAILDATLIASYFSFVNRIALTLGVELEGRFVHEASQR